MEPKVGESSASPTSKLQEVRTDGRVLQGNVDATPSMEPKVGTSPPPPTPRSQEVPSNGRSVEGNVDAPPQTPHSSDSSHPTTHDDTRPYVLMCGERFRVPERYTKGAEGRLVNNQKFIDDLTKDLREIPVRLVVAGAIRVHTLRHGTQSTF